MSKRYANMEERLLANSIRADHALPESDWGLFYFRESFCWLWLGATRQGNAHRYPQISYRLKSGPNKGKNKSDGAHRVSIKVFRNRTIRTKYVVRHLCNNTMCINPMHLAGGSKQQNTDDMMKAGRHKTPFVKGNTYGAKAK